MEAKKKMPSSSHFLQQFLPHFGEVFSKFSKFNFGNAKNNRKIKLF